MTQYDRGYPYTDDYPSPKFGIVVIAIIALLYLLPNIYTDIVLVIALGTIVLLVVNAVVESLNRR